MRLIYYILFIGISSIPFYFFNSGKPQLSHLLLSFLFIFILIRNRKIINIGKFFKGYKYLSIFILYSFIIGVIFFTLYKDFKTILAPIYFIFNIMIIYLISRLYYADKKRLLNVINNALSFSILLLFFIDLFGFDSYFHHGVFYRKLITFNNPNQLGYWALSTATILFIIRTKIKQSFFTKIKFSLSIIILIYLSILSLSKSATISILTLIILNSITNIKFSILLGIIAFFLYSNYINLDNDNYFVRFEKRMNDVGDASDDNLEGRGYYRIFNNAEYLIFGAGEGATKERFNTEIELHSSFGTILFSYGIVGLILFLSFLYNIYKIAKFKFIQLLLPLLLYGIMHMGLRFTMFWISLAIFILVFNDKTKKKYSLEHT